MATIRQLRLNLYAYLVYLKGDNFRAVSKELDSEENLSRVINTNSGGGNDPIGVQNPISTHQVITVAQYKEQVPA